jgi:hypothetical protein
VEQVRHRVEIVVGPQGPEGDAGGMISDQHQ